jgi:hypothetical protein
VQHLPSPPLRFFRFLPQPLRFGGCPPLLLLLPPLLLQLLLPPGLLLLPPSLLLLLLKQSGLLPALLRQLSLLLHRKLLRLQPGLLRLPTAGAGR